MILPVFKTDHSSVSVIISIYNEIKPSPGQWKFDNSLINDESFTEKLKNFIENLKEDHGSENAFDDQVKWQYTKFQIQKFTISYSRFSIMSDCVFKKQAHWRGRKTYIRYARSQ